MSRSSFYKLIGLCALVIVGCGWILRLLLMGLPDIQALEDYQPSLSTRVYDVHGDEIAEFSIEKRSVLPLSKIPVDLQNAVIAEEDDQFFQHWGISLKGILRSIVRDVIARRRVQGASTITQQLARQIFLKPEKTISRKIREQLLSIEIERNFSKPEILQYYLNQVYFGEGAYGVQAAARVYFGKSVQDLSLADCALLAGLIRAPRGNNPFTHPDRATKRRAIVLQRMVDEGMLSVKERDVANASPVPASKPIGQDTQAPYFVEHVRRKLEQRYGTNTLWRGGLKISTTLDLPAQKIAEASMEKALTAFDEKAVAEWQRKLKENNGLGPDGVEISTTPPAHIQGAFVLIDVKTGAIRAMVGGRDSIFNRAVQARRQPGSTFKPFVWAAALQSGMSAASLVDDAPLAYYYDGRDWRLLEGATDQYSINLATAPFAESPDFKIWVPNNFDSKFLGTITLRKALADSRNTASIRLIEKVGPPVVVDLAHRAGIQSPLDAVLSLGLGTSVVSPLEMASAFGTFANGGIYVTPYTVERVEDHAGKQLESHVPAEKEALSPQLAFLVTNLLKGVVTGGTGAYAQRLHRPVAGKTGTSNEGRDLWFIGYTPDYVAAAWMGYDDFSSLDRKEWTGGSTVVPWWTDIMGQVLADAPKKDFPAPANIVYSKIDGLTGMLALPSCPKGKIILEAFLEGTEPKKYCSVDHGKPIGPQLGAAESQEASSSGGANPASVAPALSTGTAAVPALQDSGPAPLPSDDELEQGTPSKGDQDRDEPVLIE